MVISKFQPFWLWVSKHIQMAGWESCEERLSVINPDEREIVDTAAALSDDISTQETSLAPKVSVSFSR